MKKYIFLCCLDAVVCEVLYEECLPTAGSTLDEVEAGANVANIVKDALLLVIEVGILYCKGEVVFKTTNVEGLCIFYH
jgi:hypothetical protein